MPAADPSGPFFVGSCIVDPGSRKAYKLLEVLGMGTFAVVYHVVEVAALERRHYALKCLSKKLLDEQQCEVQRKECRLHKSVGKHPRVVDFVDSFENEDWLFLLMEHVPGVDLFTWLSANHDQLHPEDGKVVIEESSRVQNAVHVFSQMLAAVAYVHSKGVFHRDLKPENFMVDPRTLDVKLIDFGLATTEEFAMEWECGSKPYMSYECRNEVSKFYSARKADVWSLGIILLNLLTHRCPWADAHPSCPEFAKYLEEREYYLGVRFGCPEKVAEFLANRVFTERDADRCSLTSMRIWADRLADDLPALLGHAAGTTPSSLHFSTETLCEDDEGRASTWSESPTECGDDTAEETVFRFDEQHQKVALPPVHGHPSDAKTLFSSAGQPTTPLPLKVAHPAAVPALPNYIPWLDWDDEEEEIDLKLTANSWFLPHLNASLKNRCEIEGYGSAESVHHGTLVELPSLPDLAGRDNSINKDHSGPGAGVAGLLEEFKGKMLTREVNG